MESARKMEKGNLLSRWMLATALTVVPFAGGLSFAASEATAGGESAVSADQKEVKNPRIAAMETEHLKLPNGLQALLVRDPNANNSSAALAIKSLGGIYEKNRFRFGVMHFLEHMVHDEEYTQFVQANGGGLNAYTAEDHVNYGFTIGTHAFPEQMPRFASRFKDPHFDPVKTQEEIKAIYNEYMGAYRHEGGRINAVGRKLSEPGHPYDNFTMGNLETLQGVTVDELREIEKNFISADQMSLVIVSSIPLAEQKKLVEDNFSDIPRFEVQLPAISKEFRKPLDGAYRAVNIKPFGDTHKLILEFPTTSREENHLNKPHEVLESIISYKGEGSLVSRLREAGVALDISAEVYDAHKNVNLFLIDLDLTSKGMAQLKDYFENGKAADQPNALTIVYDYFAFLKKENIPEYLVREDQKMAEKSFIWRSPQEGFRYAFGLSKDLKEYGLEHVETGPYMIGDYDPAAYKGVLDTISNPANMTAYLVDPSLPTDQKEKYFDVLYSYKEIGGDRFAALQKPKGETKFQFPPPNGMVDGDLPLVKEEPGKEEPHLAVDDDHAKVYFMHDNTFKVPKALMSLTVKTPMASDTARNAMLTELYMKAIGISLPAKLGPYRDAGMQLRMAHSSEGIKLSFGGFTPHLHEMIGVAAKGMKDIDINESLFNDLKEDLLTDLRNNEIAPAGNKALQYQRLIMRKDMHLTSEQIKAASSLTLQDVKDFAQKLYAETFIEGTAYGNWSDKDVQGAIRTLNTGLGSVPLPPEKRLDMELDLPAAGQHPRFSLESNAENDRNRAFREYRFLGKSTPEKQVASDLVSRVVGGFGDYFQQLRTKKQYGYEVGFYVTKVKDEILGVFNIVSGTHGPDVLDSETQLWKKERGVELIRSMPDEVFNMYKEGLASEYQSRPVSIEETHDFLAGAVDRERANFKYLEDLQQALENLTKEQVVAMAEKIMLDDGVPSATVHVRANGSNDPIPQGVITCDNKETGGDAKMADWIRSKVCKAPSVSSGMR